ncbi:TetR/AcrR family transcriptional regulator [Goodfellowiella coeruleoviolacea]|uniref:Transcriptional regulator, TetR family n=1 Tax=Goodfellowiella coeruleoviolacea TaxID=334858 RepID=A0AAE3KIR2_9PSEU|nr:TetR/AcrR family transcriptional regulator [Goodfellowiella coeruleoviolacea]MCP2168725.1 transcriptional regulator, TetR family [Goodfellowiella coeruleoviolacea]
MPPPSAESGAPARGASRKPRADAERNRARVLAAARELFTARGDEVQMPDVARAAGVGIGTVYRHFPSRTALIAAAGEQRHAEIVEFARAECLTRSDAAEGLAAYLHRIGEVLAADRGLSAPVEAAFGSTEPTGEVQAEGLRVAGDLLARAKAQGAVRADVEVTDLNMIACGLAAIIRTGSGDWRRYLRIACAGLRP